MDSEIIIKAKEEVEKLKKERDETNKKLIELDALKDNDIVKRYLEICTYNNENNRILASSSEEELILRTWRKYNYLNKETNKIYFCIGTYIVNHCYLEDDICTYYNDSRASYRSFMNIENEYDVCNIDIKYCDEFIKKNNVIFPNSFILANKEYWKLRENFLIDLINHNEEYAVKKLLKKE